MESRLTYWFLRAKEAAEVASPATVRSTNPDAPLTNLAPEAPAPTPVTASAHSRSKGAASAAASAHVVASPISACADACAKEQETGDLASGN